MHIAMIGQKGMPARFGGVERHVHDLSCALVQNGYTVTVYGRSWYTQSTDIVIDGVLVKHIPSLQTKHFDTITHTFLATIDAMRSGVDVIHYHGVGPSLLSWIPRVFTPDMAVVTTFHSVDRKHAKWGLLARQILKYAEWTACHFAHQTIAVSPTIAQYARDVYDTQTTYIPNGVCMPIAGESDPTILKTWDLEPKKYILTVSRLIAHKGIGYLIAAYEDAKKYYPELFANTKLVIVGDGHHTDNYVTKLKAQAIEDPDIIFTGFQNAAVVAELLKNAQLFVHPSDQEGLPINVLEAMAQQLPVLLSDIPEHKNLLQEEKWLFKHSDSTDLANQLAEILSLPSYDRELQGKKNFAFVKQAFNWSHLVHEVAKVYETTQTDPSSLKLRRTRQTI